MTLFNAFNVNKSWLSQPCSRRDSRTCFGVFSWSISLVHLTPMSIMRAYCHSRTTLRHSSLSCSDSHPPSLRIIFSWDGATQGETQNGPTQLKSTLPLLWIKRLRSRVAACRQSWPCAMHRTKLYIARVPTGFYSLTVGHACFAYMNSLNETHSFA